MERSARVSSGPAWTSQTTYLSLYMNAKNDLAALKRELLMLQLARTGARQTNMEATAPIPVADRSQPLPLSWAQQRMWFLDQLDHAVGAAYHIPAAFRLSGHL